MNLRSSDGWPVIKNIIIINIALFIGMNLLNRLGINLTEHLGLYFVKSEKFHIWQFVTHMFMHANLMHIFFNMFMLWMFGKILEQVWGSKRFLFYFFATGLGAAALHTGVLALQLLPMIKDANLFISNPNPDLFISFLRHYAPNHTAYDFINNWSENIGNAAFEGRAISVVKEVIHSHLNVPTVGASGAVYGVLVAFGVLFPNTPLFLFFIPIPIKAKYVIIGAAALELYQGVNMAGSNIAHFAHLGGMIFGYLIIRYWKSNRNTFY